MIRWIRANAASILFALIVLIAAVPRIGWPGLTEFKFDEATTYRSAVRLIRDGIAPTLVTSSIAGLPHPPLMAYLMALPLIAVRSPAAAVIFLALMGTAAVALTYVLGARYFSRRAGLIAAALFATSPWAIFYSRKLWPQDIPLLTLLLMFSLFALIVERRWWGIAGAALIAVMLPGIYLGNSVFVGIVLLSLIVHWRAVRDAFLRATTRARWGWSLPGVVGVIILLALMLPWLRAVFDGSIIPPSSPAETAAARPLMPGAQATLAVQVATGEGFAALAGSELAEYIALRTLPDLSILDRILMWAMLLGMAYIVIRAFLPSPLTERGHGERSEPRGEVQQPISQTARARYALLAIWMLVPLIIWTASRLPPQQYRYLALYPTQYLALAILADDGLGWLRGHRVQAWYRATGVIMAVLLGAIMLWQIAVYTGMMRLIAITVPNGGHGPAARLYWNAASEARSIAARQGLPITVNSDGDNPDQDGDAAAFDALLGDLSPRLVTGDTVKVRSPEGIIQVNARGGKYRVSLRDPLTIDAAAPTTRLANGIELLRVEPSGIGKQIAPGANVPYSVVWRVWGIPPAPDDYSYSVQLFDAGWLRRVNINDHFLRTRYWHEGDFVITSGMLRLPNDLPSEGPYHLVLTLYVVLPDGSVQPVTVLDAAMNPVGEFIDLPLP